MKSVYLYVTFDVDQDNCTVENERTCLTWRGVELIPQIQQFFESSGLVCTFFVRCDNQIRDVYGSSVYMLEEYHDLWDALISDGNELGWHPHLYTRSSAGYEPLRDPVACSQILVQCWHDLQDSDYTISSVRIGEAWHSNETMVAVDAFGLNVDSTAVPGRKRKDDSREFDWSVTPNKPYHPCALDYRRECDEGALRILEVPMTTAPIETSYDARPIRRYLNPTFRECLFRDAVEGWIRENRDTESHLVVIFHPDELLDRPGNDLHEYGMGPFRRNIEFLLSRLAKGNYSATPRRLSDALND